MSNMISLRGMEIAKQKFIPLVKQHLGVTDPHVHLDVLNVKIELTNGSTSYTVYVGEKGKPDYLEQRLKDTEMFFPTHMCLLYTKEMVDKTATTNYGNFPFFTYPDKNYFNGTNEAESLRLLSAIGSKISLRIGGTDAWRQISGHLFLNRPNGQFASGAAVSEINDKLPDFLSSIEGKGYFELFNDVALIGGSDMELMFSLARGNSQGIQGLDNTKIPDSTNVLYASILGFKYYGESTSNDNLCVAPK